MTKGTVALSLAFVVVNNTIKPNGSAALPFVIPSAAEGSAVLYAGPNSYGESRNRFPIFLVCAVFGFHPAISGIMKPLWRSDLAAAAGSMCRWQAPRVPDEATRSGTDPDSQPAHK